MADATTVSSPSPPADGPSVEAAEPARRDPAATIEAKVYPPCCEGEALHAQRLEEGEVHGDVRATAGDV